MPPMVDLRLVVVGDEGSEIVLSGRAAAIATAVAIHQERINAIPVGSLKVHFSAAQLKLDLREDMPRIRL